MGLTLSGEGRSISSAVAARPATRGQARPPAATLPRAVRPAPLRKSRRVNELLEVSQGQQRGGVPNDGADLPSVMGMSSSGGVLLWPEAKVKRPSLRTRLQYREIASLWLCSGYRPSLPRAPETSVNGFPRLRRVPLPSRGLRGAIHRRLELDFPEIGEEPFPLFA